MQRTDNHISIKELSDLLPESVTDLIDLLGFDAAEKIVTLFGGMTIKVPRHLSIKSNVIKDDLITNIGEAAADVFIQNYSNERLYIANCMQALERYKNLCFLQELDRLIKTGITQRKALFKLAPKYKISERKAFKLLADRALSNKKNSQKTLF